MIIGIISTILSSLGIYGFFCGNMFLLYIGMVSVILEHVIGIYTGQEKSLSTVWIAILVSFGMMIGGINWLQALALCLCFEGTVCFVLGIVLMLFVNNAIQKSDNEIDKSEEIIEELMTKSGLSKQICTDVYQILTCFLYNDSQLAYDKIDNLLIPHLEESNNIGNVGIAFGMLIGENALSKEESTAYSSKVIETLIEKEQDISINIDNI